MKSRFSVVLVIVASCLLYSQNDLRVISSDYSSIIIEYLPTYTDTSKVEIQNDIFNRVELLFGSVINPEISGTPAIPERLMNVGVPQEFGNTIQVLASSYTELTGKLIPKPAMIKDGDLNVPAFIVSEDYSSVNLESELVSFGEFGLIRDIRTQSIRIRPVHFDPKINKIRLYNKIVFKINYASNQNITQPVVDDLVKDAVLNFDIARSWSAADNRTQKITANSVLANGRWFRFEAPVEGIYRITHSMLASYGIDASSVDPRTIKIYNNSGKMLPESVLEVVPTDLVENAIQVIGESDGVFNTNDYILFYGRGTSFWEYDSSVSKIVRRHNVYSKENYFWITAGGNPGKRIENKSSLSGTADVVQSTTQAFSFLEEEKVNFVQSGRHYFGDEFNNVTKSRNYMNLLSGRVDGTPVLYNLRFINNHTTSQVLTVEENNNSIFSAPIGGTTSISDWNSYLTGVPFELNLQFSGSLPENRSILKFTFNASTLTSRGHLDYFDIQYTRNLNAPTNTLLFFSNDTTATIQYQLNGFTNSNISVYDITDHSNIKLITNPVVWSGGDYQFISQENKNSVSKYLALTSDKFMTPGNPVEIANSNLHGITAGAKFIIVTHRNFRDQAQRLKNYRENESANRFSTIVADIDEIFNEFSGGLKDVSGLRNFLKYAYDNWEIRPEYVLLLGDGDYDYRNIEVNNKNFILTYQIEYKNNWYRNLHHIHSYTTDDFFALISGADPFVDIAMGRINAQSSVEVSNVIDKIIAYESDKERKSWRNLISLVADDGYTSTSYEGTLHTAPSEYLSSFIIPKYFDLNKIYSAAYPDELTSAGRRKPVVNKSIIDAINQGTLILNYIGHGSPDLWAHEVIFDKNITIPQLRNDKYFFLTAATCDFGYYDIPNFQSATELMLLQKNAGCIAAISSARLVFAGENNELMYRFFGDLLNSARDTLNLSIPIGKSSFLTKQVRVSVNDKKYHLFGDPTLRLQIPQYSGKVDSINGLELTSDVQIKALSRSTIEGKILRPDSTLWSDFNGEGVLTVYDSQRLVRLTSISYNINVPGGVIFKSRISIQNGKFRSEFIVPKDISYENRNGKVLVYFYNDDADGIVLTDRVIIGGTDTTTVNDGKGPAISIHFDDASFNNANLITPNSLLIVKLSDDTGLNTTGTGIGHKLEGILNQDENNPLDFSNYFTGDIDAGGRSGEINYPFSDLAHGEYEILVKAWDVFNNFSSETEYFSVVTADDLIVRDIYNYPNPFSSNTTFTFQHNLNSSINLRIKIYSIAGRLIHEMERQNINDRFVAVDWNGRDMDGDLIANGTYLYKIVIMTTDGQYKREVLGKLAVIR